MFKLLVVSSFFVLFAYGALQFYNFLYKEAPLPDYDYDKYWGPGTKKEKEIAIHKIVLSFEDGLIDRLRFQLNQTAFYLPKPLEDVNFEYGFNSKTLGQLMYYWQTDYLDRWYGEREFYIAKYPHYETKIQGLDIHYIHVYPENVSKSIKVLPLLLLHGWPGSILEYYDLITELINQTKHQPFVFEFIVPFIPGFGYSQAPSKQGFDTIQAGIVFNNLMDRIGSKQYYIYGGDWGSIIGNQMATLFPDNVLGYHSTMCTTGTPLATIKTLIASFRPSLFIEEKYIDYYYPVIPQLWNLLEESGYFHLQATKPDTIGAALSNNPTGLAAYILEKFSTGSNLANRKKKHGGVDETIQIDKLLDNLMIYYGTNSITTSMRLYKEVMQNYDQLKALDSIKTVVPTGCARFKHEIRHVPDFILKDKFVNLIQSTYYEKGGHFAAIEYPDLLAKDIFDFVFKVEEKKNKV
uniref:Epoxide hydrolase n=1 Tax=Culicoides sonorensis TaxID=179676 RepID=A0A336LW65_CULSO